MTCTVFYARVPTACVIPVQGSHTVAHSSSHMRLGRCKLLLSLSDLHMQGLCPSLASPLNKHQPYVQVCLCLLGGQNRAWCLLGPYGWITGPVKSYAELHEMLLVTMHELSTMSTVASVLSAALGNRLLLLSPLLQPCKTSCQSHKTSLDDYVYCCR